MSDTPMAGADLLVSLRKVPDDDLVARLKSLTARERRATALLVAHLAELDTRDVYLRAGYSSLFTYCRDFLAFSDDEAYNRVVAARAARRFPVVVDLLATGELNVTTIRLLGPHLTPENHLAVLGSARGKRKAQVEEIVAKLAPRPDVRPSLRRLPHSKPDDFAPGTSEPSARDITPLPGGASRSAVPPLSMPQRPGGAETHVPSAPMQRAGCSTAVMPLSPERYSYRLTIGAATLEKLRLAWDMLRHALPSGDDEALLDRALTALLVDLARKKFAAGPGAGPSVPPMRSSRLTSSRGAESGAPDFRGGLSRSIPAAVKRAVWVRDLGRCTFVGTDGRRCGERGFVEFHHVRPYANGGEATVENIQLRCGPHNRHEARRYFARGVNEERLRDDGPQKSARSRTAETAEARPPANQFVAGARGPGRCLTPSGRTPIALP
jgi:hypothetical protein